MKKRNVILLVLLLAIGFAAVSTTLVLNGSLNIASNNEDFDVYFSNAIENEIENKKLIKDDTHLEFNKDMSLVGEKYILDYDVTNGSRNYDANITISCTESNEYLKITNEFDTTSNLLSTETRRGKLTIEVLKPYVGTSEENTKDISITCEITGTAVERDTLGEGTPNPKVEQCSIDNPTVYENGVWKYRDNDCSGDLTNGDLITLGTESFYVYDIEGDNVKALAQYNLYVGSTIDEDFNVTPLEKPTGLQDSRAIGYGTTPRIGVIAYDSLNNSNNYETSEINPYIETYANKLSELDTNITTDKVRLITKEELEKAGCDSNSRTCYDAPSYLYSTSYWTSSPHAENDNCVWFVLSSGHFGWNDVNSVIYGVRPVIEVSKSLFE